MGTADSTFERCLQHKRTGGVALDVFVSDRVWLGGAEESRPHEPFVTIGPADWEGEEELTFFKNRDEVDALITKLRETRDAAFPQTGGKSKV